MWMHLAYYGWIWINLGKYGLFGLILVIMELKSHGGNPQTDGQKYRPKKYRGIWLIFYYFGVIMDKFRLFGGVWVNCMNLGDFG